MLWTVCQTNNFFENGLFSYCCFHFSFSFFLTFIFNYQIPISTLRAVNNLVGRLTGSYQQPASSQQPQQQLFTQQQQQQQPPPKYIVSYPSHAQPAPSYYGMQRSADATQPPKTQFEMLNRLRQATDKMVAPSSTAATPPNAVARKPMALKLIWNFHSIH